MVEILQRDRVTTDFALQNMDAATDIKFLSAISKKKQKTMYRGLYGGTTDVIIKKCTTKGRQSLMAEATLYKVIIYLVVSDDVIWLIT